MSDQPSPSDINQPTEPDASPTAEQAAGAPADSPRPSGSPADALRAGDEATRDAMFDSTHGQAVESAEALAASDEDAGLDRAANVFDEPATADPAPGSEDPVPVTSEPAPTTSEPAAPTEPPSTTYSEEASEPVSTGDSGREMTPGQEASPEGDVPAGAEGGGNPQASS